MEQTSSRDSCAEFDQCLRILNLMLDNEATGEEELYVKNHIEKCMVCFEQYEVEKQIRDLIKSKFQNLPVPENLEADIRSKIRLIA
jgi:anti-sigma factor (TIGR02949 family)